MIGYINIFKPELKVKELALYESYYCGICKSIKSNYGLFKNYTLNYDCTFIAILIDALNDSIIKTEDFRCPYNPQKKKKRILNDATNFTSHINMYLIYKKIEDDVNDEHKFKYKLAKGLLNGAGKKAKENIGDLSISIDENLNSLYALEKAKCNDSIKIANYYGNIMKDICSYKFKEDERLFKISASIGYNVGKWVYLIDAYDDIEEDIKDKNYNPFVLEYEYNDSITIEKFKSDIKEKVKVKMFESLNNAVNAFELVDENKYTGLLYNILIDGIYNKTQLVMEGKCKNGKKPI